MTRHRALGIVLLLAAPAARADGKYEPRQPEAAAHWQSAQDAFAIGDFDRAAKEIAVAYSLEPATVLLYSQALAESRGGHCDRAVPLFQKFVAAPDISDAQRDAGRRELGRCAAPAPLPAKPATAPATAPPPRAWWKDRVGLGLAAGGAVGLGLGIAYLVKSSGTLDDAARAPDLATHDDLESQASSERTFGAITLAVGVGLAAGSAFVFYRRHSEATTTVVGTTGTTLFVAGRF